jgi:predicted acyltransferase
MLKPERIISVDFLRGLTVAAMILVNNPGSWEYVYAPLNHSHWNGCTPTDLVFPFFLFIVGISVSYALSVAKSAGGNQNVILMKILKRTILLFLFGLLLNFIPEFDFGSIRILGVLQRIAIVFFFSAFLFLKTSARTQVLISVGLLISYWLLMTLVPVPGIGEANLGEKTNLSAWLDNLLLGGHLWKFTEVWDPEGILSTLPAIASGLIGVLAGTWLKGEANKSDKIIGLFVIGNLLIVAALAWDMAFPINKSLWTSSYVLYTSGIAMNVLAVCFWLIDVKEYKKYTGPFMAFGSNAITAYMISEMLAKISYFSVGNSGNKISIKDLVFQSLSFDWMNLWFLSFVLALVWVALIWLPVNQMYKKKIFIKV